MYKKLKTLFVVMCCIACLTTALAGCSKQKEEAPAAKGVKYFEYFDTISYIFNYNGDSDELMQSKADEGIAILRKYHQLFDIYYEYSGINNLCTLNKMAGQGPIEVDPELITFLTNAKELYYLTNGKMNVMLGSVLKVWHDYRERADDGNDNLLPSVEELEEANKHTSIELLVIDEQNNTIEITDPLASIDVGAYGKGYATEMTARYFEEKGWYGYVLNIGGNIREIGSRPNGEGWVTGITNPRNKSGYITKITTSDTACVTSGDYERYFYNNDIRYHHIIDPDTLEPARYFAAITIVTKDSGLADALSTALFCMSQEDGAKLAEKLGNVGVLWVYENQEIVYNELIGQILTQK